MTQLAGRVGVRAADIVAWNVHRFSNITVNSRVQPGTVLFVQNPAVCDLVAVQGREETPQKLARRVGIDTQDLLQLNAVSHPSLSATSKLKPGTKLRTRDRSAEPEVFLPTDAPRRLLDMDGDLAAELQRQQRFGDPVSTGVVWPRVAEIALLAGLGCGKLLVRLALEELVASGQCATRSPPPLDPNSPTRHPPPTHPLSPRRRRCHRRRHRRRRHRRRLGPRRRLTARPLRVISGMTSW